MTTRYRNEIGSNESEKACWHRRLRRRREVGVEMMV